MDPEIALAIRSELFEEVWNKVVWWLAEDGVHVTPGMVQMRNNRLVQSGAYTKNTPTGRVRHRLEVRETPSGYWISVYRGKVRHLNFRYDLTEGTFIVGMAMVAS